MVSKGENESTREERKMRLQGSRCGGRERQQGLKNQEGMKGKKNRKSEEEMGIR